MTQNINSGLSNLIVSIVSLRNDPRNARDHDERSLQSIMKSLREFGQQKPIVALLDGTVIAGNGTLEAARRLGWSGIAAVRFDDEAKARAYAIADNRTSDLSKFDGGMLAEALSEIADTVGLDAVGFTQVELDRLLDGPALPPTDPNSEWSGMPEFDQQDKTAHRQIVMNFRSDEDVTKFGELLGQSVTDKTRSLWYPVAEIERLMDKRYAEKGEDGDGKDES